LNIKPGHQITVKEGDRVFLKARDVKNYQDFDRHLKAVMVVWDLPEGNTQNNLIDG